MVNFEQILLNTLSNSIPHRIYAKDINGLFVFANQSVALGMGVESPDDLIGKSDFDFYPKEDAAAYFAEELEIMTSGRGMIDKLEHVQYSLKEDDRWLLTTKVPVKDASGEVIGIAGINHDITGQKRVELALVVAQEKAQTANSELQTAMASVEAVNKRVLQSFKESLSLMTNMIELQDGSKRNYTRMVVMACVSIAEALNLPPREVEQIRIAALLHNIGKLSLPERLRKRTLGTLTLQEKNIYKRHPIQGEAVLSGMTGLKVVSKLVRHHKEYINAEGFPDQLIEKHIPIGSKILCVVSDFQQLESGLLVADISSPEQAITYIQQHSGVLYDARIVELFCRYHAEKMQDFRSELTVVSLAKLRPGMVLGDDLISPNDMLLLTEGSIITAANLQQFEKYQEEMGSQLVFSIRTDSI